MVYWNGDACQIVAHPLGSSVELEIWEWLHQEVRNLKGHFMLQADYRGWFSSASPEDASSVLNLTH